MSEHVGRSIGCEASRFWLVGYSDGAHLAHRYLITHSERLRSLRVSFEAAGVRAHFQLLSDIDHAFGPSAGVAATFFGGVLDRTAVPAVATR